MAFKLRMETLEQRETPAGFEPVDPITGLPISGPHRDPTVPAHPNHPFDPANPAPMPDFPIPR